MIALKMISKEKDLQEETGLNHDELCDAGFSLDDWDVCFVSQKSLWKMVTDGKGDWWDEPFEDARWLVTRMDDYCVGYTHVVYDGKHYYMVYHW